MTIENRDGDDPGEPERRSAGRRSGRAKRESSRREYTPREPRPLDAAQLQELALGYAARYATTATKLRRYLERKLAERVWTPANPPEIEALIARITSLGYVDDRAWATLKARELSNRGFGQRRVRSALSAAGVSRDDSTAVLIPDDADAGTVNPFIPAIAFARRRRLGPFAREAGSVDPARRNRELSAMARAGHHFDIARRVLMAADEAAALALIDD